MKKHIPNIITSIRLLLLPLFVFFLLRENYLTAAFIFIGASLSDLLDGYLARRWKVVSNFGKLADPIADKAIQVSAIVIFCILGKLHFVFGIILAVKESLMVFGSYLLYKKKVVVYAVWFGKLAALMMNTSIALILIFQPGFLFSNILMALAMAMEIVALALYTKRYFELKANAGKETSEA